MVRRTSGEPAEAPSTIHDSQTPPLRDPAFSSSPPGFVGSVSFVDAARSPACAWPRRHRGKCRNALPTPPKGRPYPAQVQKSVNPPTPNLPFQAFVPLHLAASGPCPPSMPPGPQPVPGRDSTGRSVGLHCPHRQREGPALHRRRTRRPSHPEPAFSSSRGSPPGFFPSVSSFDAAWSPVCAWPGRHGGKCRIALPTSTKGGSYPAQASNLANPAHPEPAFSGSCPACLG